MRRGLGRRGRTGDVSIGRVVATVVVSMQAHDKVPNSKLAVKLSAYYLVVIVFKSELSLQPMI